MKSKYGERLLQACLEQPEGEAEGRAEDMERLRMKTRELL